MTNLQRLYGAVLIYKIDSRKYPEKKEAYQHIKMLWEALQYFNANFDQSCGAIMPILSAALDECKISLKEKTHE